MDKAHRGSCEENIPPRLTARVIGPAATAGAVALGLVLVGACGLGQQDVYVAPPPLHANLQAAPSGDHSGTTTPRVIIPPSPTWRVAADPPPRRTPTTTPDDTDSPAAPQRMPNPVSPQGESSADPTTNPAAPTTRYPPLSSGEVEE